MVKRLAVMDGKNIPVRRHELDWLRVFAILVLLFFHTGRIFDNNHWHLSNNETSESFNYWMPFLHAWRMPLLLFISGVGSYFALGKSKPTRFMVSRTKRLIIPLVFAVIVILPPQAYIEHVNEFSSYGDFYKSVLNYIPFYNGILNLYHLWFIVYLFVYTLLALPVLIFLRSPYSNKFKQKVLYYFYHPIPLLLVPPILILITQFILLPNYQGRAFFAFYFCFFLSGIVFYSCGSEQIETIGKNRKYLLAAACLILVPYVISYVSLEKQYAASDVTIPFVLEICVGWFWVITIIAYGQYYFSRPSPWINTIGEGIYSFYILHQTGIVVIGYYITQLSWGVTAKFWAIIFLTLAFCVIFYLAFIRPFNIMRLLFGMKRKRPW